MSSRVLSIAACVVLGAVSFGCYNISDFPMERFAAEYGRAACDAAEACAGAANSDLFFAAGGGCDTAVIAAFRNGQLPSMMQRMERGQVVYSASEARRCIDALRASPCTSVNNGEAALACQNVWRGDQSEGSVCGTPEDCGEDQFCSLLTYPATCQPRLPATTPWCSSDRDCAAGLACRQRACVQPRNLGETCAALGDCRFGLLCGAGVCRPVSEVLALDEGQPCNAEVGPLCREGLSCVVEGMSIAGTDYVCRRPAVAGGPCRAGVPSQCPAEHTCSAAGVGPDGVCEPTTDELRCDAISGCSAGFVCWDGICLRVRENDEPCADLSPVSVPCASLSCLAVEGRGALCTVLRPTCEF